MTCDAIGGEWSAAGEFATRRRREGTGRRDAGHIEAIDDSRKFGVQRAQAALRHMHAHVLGRHRGVR